MSRLEWQETILKCAAMFIAFIIFGENPILGPAAA